MDVDDFFFVFESIDFLILHNVDVDYHCRKVSTSRCGHVGKVNAVSWRI